MNLRPLYLSGQEVYPLIEGGKGISVSNGQSSGAWAAAGGVGTFSAVNADRYDAQGRFVPMVYHGKTRKERHNELIAAAIAGGIDQARIAHDYAQNQGRLHMNVLWEMAGVEPILQGILEKTKNIVHGVTCGAGMPYRVAPICAAFSVYYYPIVSSMRAFRALWKRSFHKFSQWLGAVVYEDPWRAGGHNGLSNSENPLKPEAPFDRVLQLRQYMREVGLAETPIIMAGGVWTLSEWRDWIDNPDLGPIAFQLGTRPLLTKESPISHQWKEALLTLKPGDVVLNRFSPTGFYSSAVHNRFLQELTERSHRQIAYTTQNIGDHDTPLSMGERGRCVFVTHHDKKQADEWMRQGFTQPLRTPDMTLIFVTPEKAQEIRTDQVECMGCLSQCLFSNWSQSPEGTTGRKPDPRSFCIQKTLQAIAHNGPVQDHLMFAGHNVYRFAQDPFYKKGIPTVKELIDHLRQGG